MTPTAGWILAIALVLGGGYLRSRPASAVADEDSCSAETGAGCDDTNAKSNCKELFSDCNADRDCLTYLKGLGVAGRSIAELRTALDARDKRTSRGSRGIANIYKCLRLLYLSFLPSIRPPFPLSFFPVFHLTKPHSLMPVYPAR